MAIVYEPRPVPDKKRNDDDEKDLRKFLAEEFRRVSDSIREIGGILMPELHVAPKKPRDGMIILADGTDFDPGWGAGFYGRVDGAWVPLTASVGSSPLTWTPTLGDGTNNFTLGTAIGRYTYFLDYIIASFVCEWSSKGSAGAATLCLSLPVITANISNNRASAIFNHLDGVDNGGGKQVLGIAFAGSDDMFFQYVNDNAAPTGIAANAQSTTGSVQGHIIYKWRA